MTIHQIRPYKSLRWHQDDLKWIKMNCNELDELKMNNDELRQKDRQTKRQKDNEKDSEGFQTNSNELI